MIRARAKVRELAEVHQRKGHEMTGIELGYRYLASPVICYDPGEVGDDGFAYTYRPRAEPGFRLPHMWCADGTALHDLIDDAGFSLLKLGAADAGTGALEQALRDTGAPLTVHELAEPALRQVYGADLLLLRPDLHVAWRSNTRPDDPAEVAAVLSGHCGRPADLTQR